VSGLLVLAVETSCDETAVAILRGSGELLASEIASQAQEHQKYGGVVPEVASRNHLARIRPLILSALRGAALLPEGLDCVAATRGPGLLTALLVGHSAAKGLAIALRKPFLGINHLEGHLLSPFFGSVDGPRRSVNLIVSGGHTILIELSGLGSYRLLGRTVDDAAGEAFDKVAKMLGLPYPGGPEIDCLARLGDPTRFRLPRSMMGSGDLHFSFSGLKTAVRYLLPKLEGDYLADLCASFQEAVIDVLIRKTMRAASNCGVDLVTISGGVSCNSRLRLRFGEASRNAGIQLKLVEPSLCTDNAAMIAYAGALRFLNGYRSDLGEDADPNLSLV
jgi:N6-L-threonylcarbamoyladenine synthase